MPRRQLELPSKPPQSDPLLTHVHIVQFHQVLILHRRNIKAPRKRTTDDTAGPYLVIVVVDAAWLLWCRAACC